MNSNKHGKKETKFGKIDSFLNMKIKIILIFHHQKNAKKAVLKMIYGADAIKKFAPSLGIPYLGV